MSVSTNGSICFGVVFDEDYEFPWDEDRFDNDIYDWWKYINNCDIQSPYNESGERKFGVTDEDTTIYFNKLDEWEKQNPLPVIVENYCSDDYPMYILGVPSSVKTANRGYPCVFKQDDLVLDTDELNTFNEFIVKYNLTGDEPQWVVYSYSDY